MAVIIDGVEYEVTEGTDDAPETLLHPDGSTFFVRQWPSPIVLEPKLMSEAYWENQAAQGPAAPVRAGAVPRLTKPGLTFVVPVSEP